MARNWNLWDAATIESREQLEKLVMERYVEKLEAALEEKDIAQATANATTQDTPLNNMSKALRYLGAIRRLSKIDKIALVRTITGMEFNEAKDFVEQHDDILPF